MCMKKEYKEILKIALPAMAENLLQMAMGVVDSYLIAFLGLAALSGVSIANNMMAIYQAIFLALVAVTSSRLAYEVGRGNHDRVRQSATEAVALTLWFGFGLGSFSLFLNQSLFVALGAEKTVADAGGAYFSLVGGGVVLLGLMTSLGAILRATGKPRLPMYISVLSNVLNLIFSYIGVFVFHWGIKGVAFGTLFSRLVACVILWRQLEFPLDKFSWTIDRQLLKMILSSTGERMMMRGGDVVVVALITGLGTPVLAGNAIGESLTQFNYMPALGICTATVILTAKSQGKIQQIERTKRASLILTIIIMYLISVITYLLSPILISLFTQEFVARQASKVVILSSLIGVPFTAATLVYTAFWQGLGKPQLPFYATSIGMWGIRILLAYLLIHYTQLGFVSIWIGTTLDNLFRAIFLASIYRKEKKDGVQTVND